MSLSLTLISVENGCTMILINSIILLFIFYVTDTWSHSPVDLESDDVNEPNSTVKLLDNTDVYENNLRDPEKVLIQLYYESLCPHCIRFEVNELAPVIDTMSSYLDIQTYPFGNAMIKDDNGTLEFKCQHGPAECYGNKLHACALDKLQNTTALLYNICLMNSTENLGSDDKSADRCGKSMDIDSETIKECAKGTKGIELLQYYGEESMNAKYTHVPYVLINGEVFDGDDFKNATCNALTNQPPVCK